MTVERVPLRTTVGQLESSLSRVVVWVDDGEGLDEEESSCDTGLVI